MHVDFRVTNIDVDRSSKDRFRPVKFVSSGMLNLTLSDLTTVDSAHTELSRSSWKNHRVAIIASNNFAR